uniref:Uncharacterized protein n=1 Tax=Rhizophora mucronata TaxID=61149 RepID=A0A2P2JJL6_RHIMU
MVALLQKLGFVYFSRL